MPRPKTKGDPIQIRLPLDADRIIRERADAKGKTPAEYVTDYITKASGATSPQ